MLSARSSRPGAQVVLGQLVQGLGAMRAAQVRPGDEVLVDADGPVRLAAAAEQAAQGEVGLHRVRVHLRHADEDLDGLVRLLVEQEVQTLEVFGAGETWTGRCRWPLRVQRARNQPASPAATTSRKTMAPESAVILERHVAQVADFGFGLPHGALERRGARA